MNDITFEPPKGTYGIVYRIISPSGKSYIGQTIQRLDQRWSDHKKSKDGLPIHRAIRKYGSKKMGIVIVATARNQEGLDTAEQFYIKRFNTLDKDFGYNIKDGGAHGKHSDETKQKISESNIGMHDNTGIKNPMFGRHHSDETKQKIRESKIGKHFKNLSEALTGRTLSKETKEKIGAAIRGENHPWFGRHHSDETKEKLRQARLGTHHSEETKAKIAAYRPTEETRRKMSAAHLRRKFAQPVVN